MEQAVADTQDTSLLGRYRGERPPAADWIVEALADAPERSTYAVEGTDIELLTWGERGKPGLLFLHGNGAHADWWSIIAPFFAKTHRCAAISWGGMGGSGWRKHYSVELLGQELLGAIDAAGLDEGPGKPIVIAHSFGGTPLMYVGANFPDRMAAGILIDSFVPLGNRKPGWVTTGRPTRRYAEVAEALARFRFAPEQDSAWPEIVDLYARGALRYAEEAGDQPAGWTWRFDPELWSTLDRSGIAALVGQIPVPIALIRGEDSKLGSEEATEAFRALLQNCPIVAAIPGARHHIMVDQPLALIAALRVTVSALQSMTENA